MMTVITRVRLEQGKEPEWDEAMRDRMETARSAAGWLSGQILIPLEGLDQRVIVGLWETRADWEAWHNDPAFKETRERLARLGVDDGETEWYEVIYEARAKDD